MSAETRPRVHDSRALKLGRVRPEPVLSPPPALPRQSSPALPRRRSARLTRGQLRPLRRQWIGAHQGWLGFAGLILTGTLLTLSVARTTLLLPESVRPLPNSLAGAFGQGGIDLGLGGLIVVLSLMFVAYAAMVRGARQLTARTVLIGIGCLNLLVLLAPPMLSTDMFSYIAYGRIGGIYGSNPYLFGPSAIALDPLYPFIGAQWVHTPTTYGPLFTIVSYILAPLSIAVNVMAYKMIAAVSSLVLISAVWSAARLRGLNPVRAVAIVGLNPVIVVYGAGGGHNDLLMMAILFTGAYALLQGRERASGALIVTAAAVKLTAGLLLPFALAQSMRERPSPARFRALLAGAGAAATVVVGLSFAVFGTGTLHLLATLQQVQGEGGLHSIPGLVFTLVGHPEAMADIGIGFDVILVACVVWLVRRVWLGRLDWITGAGWATVAMLCTAGLLVPWYVGWLMPLAALSRDRRLLATSVVLTGLVLTTL